MASLRGLLAELSSLPETCKKAIRIITKKVNIIGTHITQAGLDSDLRKINADYAIKYPKTLKDGLDEFLNLFTEAQQDELRDETNYDEFVKIIKEKDKLPIDKLDTREEVAEAQKIIRENLIEQGYINT